MAMSKAERERCHQAQLARIRQVRSTVGTGDRSRIDQVGTLLEQAQLMAEELRSHDATENGLAAFERLLRRAEELGPARDAADLLAFVDAVCGHRPLPLGCLRGHPMDIGDDMLAVLDAFRHARFTLAEQLDGGPARVARLLDRRRSTAAA